eukprot:m.26815 g.26815  ORF g.26815 m.26815 type:complete len:240 (-) comp11717_c0_seq1:96-815(-)
MHMSLFVLLASMAVASALDGCLIYKPSCAFRRDSVREGAFNGSFSTEFTKTCGCMNIYHQDEGPTRDSDEESIRVDCSNGQGNITVLLYESYDCQGDADVIEEELVNDDCIEEMAAVTCDSSGGVSQLDDDDDGDDDDTDDIKIGCAESFTSNDCESGSIAKLCGCQGASPVGSTQVMCLGDEARLGTYTSDDCSGQASFTDITLDECKNNVIYTCGSSWMPGASAMMAVVLAIVARCY